MLIMIFLGSSDQKNNPEPKTNNAKPDYQDLCEPIPSNKPYYQNLKEPIYLVLEDSLWTDCNKRTASPTCRQDREATFRAGADEWFKHFDELHRPKAVFVSSADDVPTDAINKPIHLSMKDSGCILGQEKTKDPACFFSGPDYPKIVFAESAAFTIPTMAHEFGHALWLNHRDTFSIMNPNGKGNRVLPIDMITLCALHDECPPHDETWCEGTFSDKCRCPSASFADSEIKSKEQNLVCP